RHSGSLGRPTHVLEGGRRAEGFHDGPAPSVAYSAALGRSGLECHPYAIHVGYPLRLDELAAIEPPDGWLVGDCTWHSFAVVGRSHGNEPGLDRPGADRPAGTFRGTAGAVADCANHDSSDGPTNGPTIERNHHQPW